MAFRSARRKHPPREPGKLIAKHCVVLRVEAGHRAAGALPIAAGDREPIVRAGVATRAATRPALQGVLASGAFGLGAFELLGGSKGTGRRRSARMPCWAPAKLKGTKAEGAACEDALECRPSCCSCSNASPNNWLAVSCRDGKCASGAVACF